MPQLQVLLYFTADNMDCAWKGVGLSGAWMPCNQEEAHQRTENRNLFPQRKDCKHVVLQSVSNGSDRALGDNNDLKIDEGDVSNGDDLGQFMEKIERHCIANDQVIDGDEGDTDELFSATRDWRTSARTITAPERFSWTNFNE